MPRPPKTNADYFPHDAHMRNDPRILALRRKFGLDGYAVYVMTVEALSNASHFRLNLSDSGREILAGDFGLDEQKFTQIIQYCVQIDLFQLFEDELMCQSLDNRLVSLLNRRVSDDINPTETPQEPYSKVKESKVKESKADESKTLKWFDSCIDEIYKETLTMTHKGKDVSKAIAEAWAYVLADPNRLRVMDSAGAKKLVNTWLSKTSETKAKKPKAFEL